MSNITFGGLGEWEVTSPASLALLFLILPLITVATWSLWSYVRSPLRAYPGPFLAKWTNFWRFWQVSNGQYDQACQELHQKYGPIVCVAPDHLIVDIPSVAKDIYSNTKGEWKKSRFYEPAGAMVGGRRVHNMFSEQDKATHTKMRKPIAKLYAMPSVLPYEPHMDRIVSELCEIIESKFIDGPNGSQEFDLGKWLHFYTWDVIGSVTFSKPIGYLEKGYDFDKTLDTASRRINWFVATAMLPWYDWYVNNLPFLQLGPPGFDAVVGLAIQLIQARATGADKTYHDPADPDYLDKFFELKMADPDGVSDMDIMTWLMNNLLAGADSTATTLRSSLYFPLKNPRVWQRLREATAAAGLHKNTPVPYKDARAVPYVDAVVRESLRYFPPVSMPLERYVPKEGYQLSNGRFLPAGVAIGVNPYVISRNREIYGDDADEFRPERWLRDEGAETEEEFQKRLGAMNSADLGFGAGSRTCIGKNLGLVQVYRVLATLVSLYDFELVDQSKDWKVVGCNWFPQQQGINVKARRRVYT
ncbi:cytochrome P450 [Thozetella sp. PMI_491]|nr:cytochrome P450 [Thozetella sp. PMI_491]